MKEHTYCYKKKQEKPKMFNECSKIVDIDHSDLL